MLMKPSNTILLAQALASRGAEIIRAIARRPPLLIRTSPLMTAISSDRLTAASEDKIKAHAKAGA
jgi:hypothetical protein